MKKVSLLLAIIMLMSVVGAPAFAEDSVIKESASGFFYIEAAGDQIALSAADKATFIQADQLYFKDLNKNGALDAYEDWRLDVDERITNMISQMTLEEKLALMIHCNTAGQYTGTYPTTDEYLYEQNCPFEVPDLGKWNTASGYSAWWYVNKYGITHFLDNTNGTAAEQIYVHNAIQQMCEDTRLGTPMTFSCDRYSNGWGGFADAPHDAFATAANAALDEAIISAYMAEMKAIGYHLLLHPYGVEIGAFYGEDPEYIADMIAMEVKAIESNGMDACVKHWIARGGDSSFANARSVAQTVDNWMVPWKAAIDAGTAYIMCSTIPGFTNTCEVVFEKEAMSYLRDTLGYDGVVLTDWTQVAAWGILTSSGATPEGIEPGKLSLKEVYGLMFSNGVDQVGNVSVMPGEDYTVYNMSSAYPDAMKSAVEEGYLDIANVEASDRRILRAKFELGLFENPYCDTEAAMKICASDEYTANPWAITNPDELAAARNPELVALERQLQAESTVLVKNEGNLLPLQANAKVNFVSTNATSQVNYTAALSRVATVVETMAEADVVIIDATAVNDAVQLSVEDAKAAGKPVVMTLNCTDPTTWAVENADAILFLNYKCTPDHGSALNGFTFLMEPGVYADLLFGKVEPNGMIVKEIARDNNMNGIQWKDLAGDQGASSYVRLMLLAMMKENPAQALPNNFGDPLLCYEYGMHYNKAANFVYDTLVVPTEAVETAGSYGRTVVSSQQKTMKSGEAFTLSFLLWNHGDDGMTTVKAYDGENLVAEKIIAVNDNSWRVVEIELTLEGAGEHVIKIGGLSATITVE